MTDESSSSPATKKAKKPSVPVTPAGPAEVIALSPKTLLATNQFVCEVCSKRFKQEQNLQMHRRAHNLPWSLKRKEVNPARRQVYVCPEPTCVHHDPAACALTDLSAIRKHFRSKHGGKNRHYYDKVYRT
uniref:C2H2-type domain-containing protein n=1 Tax=Leersia perrieri TaxID=77586 RepID=A0A0D9XD06_9ORYZ